MVDWKNWKIYGRAVLGGTITLLVGGFLIGPFNQYITFIPKDLLKNFLGLTPHLMLAYGIGFVVGDLVNEKFLKM